MVVMIIGVLITAYLVSFFLPPPETTKANLTLAEQQYSLGQFHLNKGQAVNIKKAVNYFQQSLTMLPPCWTWDLLIYNYLTWKTVVMLGIRITHSN
jgi:TPR repeat protein